MAVTPIKYYIADGNPGLKGCRKRYTEKFQDAVLIKQEMERKYGNKFDIYGQFYESLVIYGRQFNYVLVPYEKYDMTEEERWKPSNDSSSWTKFVSPKC